MTPLLRGKWEVRVTMFEDLTRDGDEASVDAIIQILQSHPNAKS